VAASRGRAYTEISGAENSSMKTVTAASDTAQPVVGSGK